jgi:hypothetical protein
VAVALAPALVLLEHQAGEAEPQTPQEQSLRNQTVGRLLAQRAAVVGPQITAAAAAVLDNPAATESQVQPDQVGPDGPRVSQALLKLIAVAAVVALMVALLELVALVAAVRVPTHRSRQHQAQQA